MPQAIEKDPAQVILIKFPSLQGAHSWSWDIFSAGFFSCWLHVHSIYLALYIL